MFERTTRGVTPSSGIHCSNVPAKYAARKDTRPRVYRAPLWMTANKKDEAKPANRWVGRSAWHRPYIHQQMAAVDWHGGHHQHIEGKRMLARFDSPVQYTAVINAVT